MYFLQYDNFSIPGNITDIFQTTAKISLIAHWVCAVLGLFSILLNSFVTVVLAVNRKVTRHNVFYLLVMHCAFVEMLQAVSLVTWCLPSLGIFALQVVVKLTTVKQWVVLFLRCLNMLTILNLLLFTINEFVVVKKPLFYRRVSRKMVGILVALAWLLSFGFGAGNIVSKHLGSNIQSVYVPKNYGNLHSTNNDNSDSDSSDEVLSWNGTVFSFEATTTQSPSPSADYFDALHRRQQLLYYGKAHHLTTNRRMPPQHVPTRDKSPDDFHFPFLFATIVVCLSSLVIVVSCYGLILKRVRRFHRDDFRAGSDCRSSSRRTSTTSFTTPAVATNGVNNINNNLITHRPSIFSGNFYNSRPSTATTTTVYVCRKTRRLNVSRHKYLLVIGSVLFVDVLFIVPYSTIQLLQYLYLTGYQLPSSYWWTQPRWILQLLIGLHSVLQPLCYFRMKEFRRMARCGKSGIPLGHI